MGTSTAASTNSSRPGRAADDRGTGVIGTVTGVGVFVVLLVFCAQVLFGLYATSVVGAVAYDAAKTAAGADALNDPGGHRGAITADARTRLGALGDAAVFSWHEDADVVQLTVRVPAPGVLPGFFRRDIVRTMRVRAERLR